MSGNEMNDGILGGEEQVLGLDVAMSKSSGMHMLKSQEGLSNSLGRIFLSETTKLDDTIEKLASVDPEEHGRVRQLK